jgi:hypothetical protein
MARHPESLGKPADYYQHSICGRVKEVFEVPVLQYTFYFGKKLPKGEDDAAILDAGAGYGPKQGGLTYGWSCGGDADVDMQKGRRGRKRAGGLGLNLFDKKNTCCYGKNAKGKCKGDDVAWKPVNWELHLPVGVYDIEVIFPEEDTSECQVEGELACQASADLEDIVACTYKRRVTVTDGRLTVTGYSFKSEKCTSLAKVMVASATTNTTADSTTTTATMQVPPGYTHVGSNGMCTDVNETAWNGGIEVGTHPRSNQDSLQSCADRCGQTEACQGVVYWTNGECRTYKSCDRFQCHGCHEYTNSEAFRKAAPTTQVLQGYAHVGSNAMCTDVNETAWNGSIEVGTHPRSNQDSLQSCADQCRKTDGCHGIVYWTNGNCRTYRACDRFLCQGCHEYLNSQAFRAIAAAAR